MKKISMTLAALVCVGLVALGVMSDSRIASAQGGFPSRPNFQGVGLGSSVDSVYSGSNTFRVLNSYADGIAFAIATNGGSEIFIADNAHWDGANWRYILSAPAAVFSLSTGSPDYRYAATGAAGAVITWTDDPFCRESGTNCSSANYAAGGVFASGTTCSVNYNVQGLSSCQEVQPGQYNVTISPGFSTDYYACTASVQAGTGYFATVTVGTSKTVFQVDVWTTAGALIAEPFSFICNGT